MDTPAPTLKLPTTLLVVSALGLFATTLLLAFQNISLQKQIFLLESRINSKTTPTPTPTSSTSITPTIIVGRIFCGGIAGVACPSGFVCKLDGAYPDAGGMCEINNQEGTLEAVVIVSPTCPGAMRPGDNCEGPFSDHPLKVIDLSNKKTITVKTDKNGKFTITLPAGSYNLQNTTTGIGKDIKNSNFIITGGKTINQRFDIDTGIR